MAKKQMTSATRSKIEEAVSEAKAAGFNWASLIAIVIQIINNIFKPTPAPAQAKRGAGAACEPCHVLFDEAMEAAKCAHDEDYEGAATHIVGQSLALAELLDDPDADSASA